MSKSRTIEISDDIFKRIQRLAEPLVDTPDSILKRVLDRYEEQGQVAQATSSSPSKKMAESSSAEVFDPNRPPDLTHTRVIEAQVCGRSLRSPNWNAIVDEVVRAASNELTGRFTLRKIAPVNFVEGEKTDEGYHYLSDIKISVQGQSANDAWRTISKIARQFGYQIDVSFCWREKEGAAYPGQDGHFLIAGRA